MVSVCFTQSEGVNTFVIRRNNNDDKVSFQEMFVKKRSVVNRESTILDDCIGVSANSLISICLHQGRKMRSEKMRRRPNNRSFLSQRARANTGT
jgi:hypothetical protein